MKTKKILSLILAVLMVASIIPASIISIFAADTNTETFGGVTYNTVQIYGGPTSPSVTGWGTYNTDLSKLTASGLNAADAEGILIDVAWNKSGLSKAQIKFKWDDATGTLKAGGNTDGEYYGNGSYASGSSATGNWLEVPTAAWEGTIFLSKATLDTWSKTDFSVFRFALSAGQTADNTHASFSNVRLAFVAPREDGFKLPNGEAAQITLVNTSTGRPEWVHNTWKSAYWKTALELEQSEGLLFKIDTTAATDTSKPLQMSFAISLYDATGNTSDTIDKGDGTDASRSVDGGSSYILGAAGTANYFGESSERVGATSTWYFLEDGKSNWAAFENTTADPLVEMDIGATTGYVYVPLDSMYYRYGETQMKGGTYVKSEPFETAVNALEARRGGMLYHFNTYFGINSSTNGLSTKVEETGTPSAVASISEISVVHKNDLTYTYDAPVPDNFPGVTGATGFNRYSMTKSTENALAATLHTAIHKDNINNAAIAEGFADASGVLVNIDTTKTFGDSYGSQLGFQFRMQVYAKTKEGKSITLQICNSPFVADGYNSSNWNTTKAKGTNSIGYATVSGKGWYQDYAYANGTSGYHMTSRVHGKSYFYIPADQWYVANPPSTISSAYEGRTEMLTMADVQALAKAEGGSWAFTGFYSVETYCWNGGNYGGSTSPFASLELIVPTYEDYGTQPNTLPDGSAYLDSTLISNFVWDFERNSTSTWQNFDAKLNMTPDAAPQGVMFKIDTTNAASGGDDVGIMFRMSADFKVADSSIKTDGNVSATYITANPKLAGVSETSYWYISRDGKTWDTVAHTSSQGSYCPITTGREIAYVYIPFTSMWIGTTNENVVGDGANGGTTSVADIIAKTGGFNISGWRLYLNTNSNDKSTNYRTAAKNTLMSDFRVVNAYDGTTNINVSTSLTDSFAMNFYADIPYGSNPVLTINGEKIDLVSVATSTGISKYRLGNILPQEISPNLNYNLTFTVPGATKATTISGTTSIYNYTKNVIASNDISPAWKNLAQAIINYAAAAQAKDPSYTGTKVDASDVKNIAGSVTDYNALGGYNTFSVAGNGGSKFISAALRLEGSLVLRVKTVGVSNVTYQIGSRTGSVAVAADGYAYIPVFAYELDDAIVITDAAATGDSITVSVNYYIANVTASGTDAALINAIANYGYAAQVASNTSQDALATETLAQMAITDASGGMSYVMQLKDGRFIVIDGGMSDPQDRAHLYEYLCLNSPTAKPVVAAWFFTHIHKDHTTTAFYIMEQYSSKLVVESVYYAFQTDESWFSATSDKNAIKDIVPRLENLPNIYPNIKLIDMNIGDQYTIGGVTIDVLIDESGNSALGTGHKDTNSDHNDFSAAIKFTFASGKTLLVLGDCTATRLKALTAKYNLKSDVMQAAHHGLVGGELNAYKEINPDITLYPTKYSTLYNYNYHGILPQYFWTIDYNKWLRENSDCYYCSTDANDTTVRTVVINMADLSVSDWSELPTDWNDEQN